MRRKGCKEGGKRQNTRVSESFGMKERKVVWRKRVKIETNTKKWTSLSVFNPSSFLPSFLSSFLHIVYLCFLPFFLQSLPPFLHLSILPSFLHSFISSFFPSFPLSILPSFLYIHLHSCSILNCFTSSSHPTYIHILPVSPS